MFTKLIFTFNQYKIEFHAHEILYLAQQIAAKIPSESVNIPHGQLYQEFMNDLANKGELDDKIIISGKKDPLLLLPLRIERLNTIGKWMHVARHLAKAQPYEFLQGWWICLSHRFLLLKNSDEDYSLEFFEGNARKIEKQKAKFKEKKSKTFLIAKRTTDLRWFLFAYDYDDQWTELELTEFINRLNPGINSNNFADSEEAILKEVLSARYLGYSQLFYVSDHGFAFDIIKKLQELVFNTPWTDPAFASFAAQIRRDKQKLQAVGVTKLKKKLARSIQTSSLKELKDFHPTLSKKELDSIKRNSRSAEYIDEVWSDFSEANQFIIDSLCSKFSELRSKDSNFPINIYRDYGAVIGDRLVKRIVLLELAIDINKGNHKRLFRPLHAYGKRNRGDSYHDFERNIQAYLIENPTTTTRFFASKMRLLLSDGHILDDSLAFLVNLVAVWFIAEASRNSLCLLTGLILLDLLEQEIQLPGRAGQNWYTLPNTILHPCKRSGEKNVKNLYQQDVGIDRFGGCHPMAHSGSVAESKKPLLAHQPLNSVQQKEAHLLLHWLYLMYQKNPGVYQIESCTTAKTPLTREVVYDEIASEDVSSPKLVVLENKIKKLKATIRVKLSKDANANINKEKIALTSLNLEKQRLLHKQTIQRAILTPFLISRSSTLENLLAPNLNQHIRDEHGKKSKEDLRKNALNYGYHCVDVLGDGNCFFYSLADQLKRQGKTGRLIDHRYLRQLSADEVEKNRDFYLDFIREDERQETIEKLQRPHTFVDMMTARALAMVLRIIIVIIPHDGGQPQVLKPFGAKEVIVIGNEVGLHFQSLVHADPVYLEHLSEVATPRIQTIIEQTPDLEEPTPQLQLPRFLEHNPMQFFHLPANEILEKNRHLHPYLQQQYDKQCGLSIIRRIG